MDHPQRLLDVQDLRVRFETNDGEIRAVDGLSFRMRAGETLGIVGESGSGKSQTVLSMLGLLASNGRAEGRVDFRGTDLLSLTPAELNRIRGDAISIIFQDPMTSLNPYLRISKQMAEVLVLHKGMSEAEARRRAIEMLDAVKIPDAANRVDRYPHEFSGGMRQRVMIAMALLCQPALLIADEPTTALDVTVQAQIMHLMRELKADFDTSIILITHDLGVVAGLCDTVLVMYAGEMVEYGPVEEIFERPLHPYTQGLLESVPRLDRRGGTRLHSIPGNPPNLLHLPPGCPFQPRCERRLDRCAVEKPSLVEVGPDRLRACHLEVSHD
ncbi:MAG TPA: ATP-binding cassette domain-containing protein [Thiotrichales bacterium]|nr:ATP-binding cassette domain-containing protein [Thiotrichales bacterium]